MPFGDSRSVLIGELGLPQLPKIFFEVEPLNPEPRIVRLPPGDVRAYRSGTQIEGLAKLKPEARFRVLGLGFKD